MVALVHQNVTLVNKKISGKSESETEESKSRTGSYKTEEENGNSV